MNAMDENNIILEVKGLKQYFPIYQGLLQRVVGYVKAVDGVELLASERAKCLAWWERVVAAKRPLGRTILRLYDPTSGEIRFRNYRMVIGSMSLAFSKKL